MLDEGALVNNSLKKDPKILLLFRKIPLNILNLENGVEKKLINKLKLLADNMIKEFKKNNSCINNKQITSK